MKRDRELAKHSTQKETEAVETSEEKLDKSHQLLHTMFEGISDPLFMLDQNLNIKVMNKAAKTYYAIDQKHRCGKKRCFEFLKKSKKPCKNCVIGTPSGIDTHQVFERKGFKDPRRIEQITIYPSRNLKGALVGAIIRICDITESKWIEQQLLQREKLASIGFLTSGIVHEINNPNNFTILNIPVLREYLNALVPFLKTHQFDPPPFTFKGMDLNRFTEEIFYLLDDIDQGAKRINSIVSGLGKYVSERRHRDKKSCDLNQMIENAMDLCRPQIKNKIQSLDISMDKKMPMIFTDPNAFEQVLINLLINASHAADKKDAWVTIDAKKISESYFTIQMKDNGCGMDEATSGRIFDPFFTTKSPGNGTGLGLYLSYNIVTSLGGTITVQSEPGIGSCFTIRLPINDKEI